MLSGLNLAFVSESLAFAPALDVKIDAAYQRHLLRRLSDVERSKSSVRVRVP